MVTALKVPLIAFGAMSLIVLGVALGRGGPATAAAPTVQPAQAAAMAAMPAPAVATPARAAPPAELTVPAAASQLAEQIGNASGEQLVAALWAIEQRATNVSYAQLERNAARYTGTAVVFSGEVLEIQDIPGERGSFLRIGLGSYGQRVVAVVAHAQPSDDVVRGRRVRAYGMLNGSYSYRSQAGWEITIPRLDAVAVVPSSTPRRPVGGSSAQAPPAPVRRSTGGEF